MPYCNQCKNQIGEGHKYCGNCGAKIPSEHISRFAITSLTFGTISATVTTFIVLGSPINLSLLDSEISRFLSPYAFIAIGLIAVGLGITALLQIHRKKNLKGKGLAIAGITSGGYYFFIFVLFQLIFLGSSIRQ